MKKYFFIFYILFSLSTKGQTEVDYVNPFVYDNAIYKNTIKTVQLNRIDFEFSYPIIRLNSDDKLQLQFDDLDSKINQYYYTIIHCNADWEPTNMPSSDYIDGYKSQIIADYKYSYNTFTQYLHYKIDFPTEVLKPTKSGNYILKVFIDDDDEKLALSRRFMVVEEKVAISATAKQATDVAYRKFKQEIDFEINLLNSGVTNPYEEVDVVILQNFRIDNACKKLKPQFINDNLLTYNYEEENTFWAGNEYRTFDTRNLKYKTQALENISFDTDKKYHIYLFKDEKRSYKKYSQINDLNGAYSIRVEGSNDPQIDAEYTDVHFSLSYPMPENEGNIYIFGELSDWQCKPEFKMKYNTENKTYNTQITLKQGYFNYNYAFRSNFDAKIDEMAIEGSHAETENDYIILVYYNTIGKFHQQLIGFSRINSVKK